MLVCPFLSPCSARVQGIPEVDHWEAANWTIPLLGDKYPTMKVKVGEDDDDNRIEMTMAAFAR